MMQFFPVFGKLPSGARLERIRRSTYYTNEGFRNLVPTPMIAEGVSYLRMFRQFFGKPADTVPAAPLPSVRTDLRKLPEGRVSIVWFGHSSYLLRVAGLNILVDPVFGGHASPFPLFAKAFPGTGVYGVKDMPAIDILLLTHDHYDHLDYPTIVGLTGPDGPGVGQVVTSLGVGSHLEYWGVPAEKIKELEWGETVGIDGRDPEAGAGRKVDLQGVESGGGLMGGGRGTGTGGTLNLTATPARHFSGRGMKRGRTFWSSFVLKTGDLSLFLGGDSGYERHFTSIGEQYGPFDIAILECGQYNANWPYIHMMPEQTVQAAKDLGARVLMPVHWGKFSLSMHAWREPIERVTAAAAANGGMVITTPRIGEPVILGAELPRTRWW